MKRTLALLFLLLLLAPPLWADAVERQYELAARDFKELYRDTAFRKQADNWIRTIDRFKAIVEAYPKHRRAPQSLLNIGLLYRSLYRWNKTQENLDQSILHFRKLASDYPKSVLADDGLFRLAENYETFLNDKERAYLEYEKVIKLFPQGDFAPLAKKKLTQLPEPPKETRLRPAPESKPAEALKPSELFDAHFGGLDYKEAEKRNKALVSRVDYWSSADWSRMVINVKDQVHYKYQVLPEDKATGKGRRMYLDLYKSFLPKDFQKKIASQDGLIQQARIAQFNSDTVRVVLDLESLKRIKVFHLELPNQYKLVIDILGESALSGGQLDLPPESAQAASAAKAKKLADVPVNPPVAHEDEAAEPEPKAEATPKAKPSKTAKPKAPAPEAEAESEEEANFKAKPKPDAAGMSLSKALGLKVHRIILDPGHGGKDPGAIGPNKTLEKDIALKLALNLKWIIQKRHPEIEVLMTRSGDKYISLEARTAFANQQKGDLFVSIHLNASRKTKVSGIETYTLNLTSDKESLALAAYENQTSTRGIAQLQNMLQNLMRNSKIQESNDLAQFVQAQTVGKIRGSRLTQVRNLGVKSAPFVVLLGANMPSILVESGFITNPKENKLLNTLDYRRTVAEGIYQGLKRYMEATNTI